MTDAEERVEGRDSWSDSDFATAVEESTGAVGVVSEREGLSRGAFVGGDGGDGDDVTAFVVSVLQSWSIDVAADREFDGNEVDVDDGNAVVPVADGDDDDSDDVVMVVVMVVDVVVVDGGEGTLAAGRDDANKCRLGEVAKEDEAADMGDAEKACCELDGIVVAVVLDKAGDDVGE